MGQYPPVIPRRIVLPAPSIAMIWSTVVLWTGPAPRILSSAVVVPALVVVTVSKNSATGPTKVEGYRCAVFGTTGEIYERD
jgi:hypothetical protein